MNEKDSSKLLRIPKMVTYLQDVNAKNIYMANGERGKIRRKKRKLQFRFYKKKKLFLFVEATKVVNFS